MTHYYRRGIGSQVRSYIRGIRSLAISEGERREQPLRFGTNFAG